MSTRPFWAGQSLRKPITVRDAGVRSLLSDAGGSILTKSAGILPGNERGRKHYEPKLSGSTEWKATKTRIELPERPATKSGKLPLTAPKCWVPGAGQKVHSTRFNAVSGPETESEFGSGLKIEKKGRAVDSRSGLPRAYVPSDELSLDTYMGRKRRVDPTRSKLVRNDLGVARPGDKCYSNPQYAPGFYKQGSGIPGAASGLFKPLPKYSSGASKTKGRTVLGTTVHGLAEEGPAPTLPSSYNRLTLEQRRIAEAIAADVSEIAALDDWTKKLTEGSEEEAPPTEAES